MALSLYLEIQPMISTLKQPKIQTKTPESFSEMVDTGQFINSLTDVLKKKCGFEVSSIKTKVVNKNKHFILEVNSQLNNDMQ